MMENPVPLAIFMIALTLRALYQITLIEDPFFHYLRHIPDSHLFHNWAIEISSENKWWGDEIFFIGPLYGYFLAIIYKLFGPDPSIIRMTQAVLDSISTFFIYIIARRLSGSKITGYVAGGIWAIFLPSLFFAAMLLPTTLIIFLVTAAFALIAVGISDKGSWKHYAGAGALIALASLGRPNLALFAFLGAIPFAFIKAIGWRKAIAFVIPVIAIIGFTTIRNAAVGDDFVPISYQAGINFYIGNNENATGVYGTPEEMRGRPKELNKTMATDIAVEKTSKKLKPSEVSSWWLNRGVRYIRENPGDAAKLYWQKFRLLTNDFETSLNVDYYFMKFLTPFHKVIPPYFGLVFAFGIAGIVVALIERKRGVWFLLLYLGLYSLSVLLFFVSSGYRLPMVPILVVFAAIGGVRVFSFFKEKQWVHSLISVVVVAGILGFTLWMPAGASKTAGFSQSYYRYGKYYFDNGEYDDAISQFNRAISLKPDYFQAYLLLGLSYTAEGELENAAEMLTKAVYLNPDSPEANFELALVYLTGKNFEQAQIYMERAAQLDPQNPMIWEQLAFLYTYQQDYSGAMFAYSQLIVLAPEYAPAHQRYAEVLMQLGMVDAALAEANIALKFDPAQSGSNLLLGKYYWSIGRPDIAETHFQREIELSPNIPHIYLTITQFYLSLEQPEAAIKYYSIYKHIGGQPVPEIEMFFGTAQ